MFAYGQTSSGKTYTMEGPQNWDIILKAFQTIDELHETDNDSVCTTESSLIPIDESNKDQTKQKDSNALLTAQE